MPEESIQSNEGEFSEELTADDSDSISAESIRMTKQLLTEQFTLHRERLWRTVQVRMDTRLYGRVDPDDVLQEAYMDAMKRVGHFAEELSYSPFVWLRLVVGQVALFRRIPDPPGNGAQQPSPSGFRFVVR